MTVRKLLFSFIMTCLLIGFISLDVHAETYGPCVICHGSGKCELCDPAKAGDRLGDGWLTCIYCNQTGYITCGTNHTGDGTPIGCDGSGYMPDGSVCATCGGTGKYPCDVCYGSGVFECKCRQMGQPGLCTLCFGTGWRQMNSMGEGINTVPVYPTDGSTIDASNWGRAEYYTYDASRYGLGISPDQFLAIRSGNNSQSQGNGQSGDGQNNNGHQGDNQNNGGQNNGGQGNSDQGNHDGDGNPPGPGDEGPAVDWSQQASLFRVEVYSDSEIEKEIDSDTDSICFICRDVDGEYLFSVSAIKSQMSPEELSVLSGMTAEDIADFKARLEAAANGFVITDSSSDADGLRIEIESGHCDIFPFRCEVVIETPLASKPDQADLFNVIDDKFYGIPVCPIRDVDSSGEHIYLSFTTDRLGKFVYTGQPVDSQGMMLPAGEQITYDHSEKPEDTAAGTDSNVVTDSVAPSTQTIVQSDVPLKSSMSPIIIYIVLGAVIGAGVVLFFLKKKQ